MSAHRRPPANDIPGGGLAVKLFGKAEAIVRAKAKEAHCDEGDFVRECLPEAIEDWLLKHRNNKPPLITNDDLDERNGSDWDGVCL